MPHVQTEEAAPNANRVRLPIGLRDRVWDLAQLASGENPEAWQNCRAYKFLDPAHRRIVRWMKACNVKLRRWFAVKAGDWYELQKAKLSAWLQTKHKTLSKAIGAGEILQIDVLDAVERGPFSTASGPSPCSLLTALTA